MTSLDEARTTQSVTGSSVSSVFRQVGRWWRRRRGYAQMEELDDHLLRDIGVTKWDLREMRRHW